MAQNDPKFLLGYGERLTSPVVVQKGGSGKLQPYTFDQAKRRLAPKLKAAARAIRALPDKVCPGDQVVAAVTLHPAFLAKSYYPDSLFEAFNVRAVGSRPVRVTPDAWTRKGAPEEMSTTELFVAGTRKNFAAFTNTVEQLNARSSLASEILKIEDLHVPSAKERVRRIRSDKTQLLLEIVLHAGGQRATRYVLDGFEEYLRTLDLEADLDRRMFANGLCFMPLKAPREKVEEIAEFTFLRVLREMPSLRQFRPVARFVDGVDSFKVKLPTGDVIDKTLSVAIFDGGVPANAPVTPWVTVHEPAGIGASHPSLERHGLAVTSAFLFGPLEEDKTPDRPMAKVDHHRVLDTDTDNDPQGELFEVLKRIRSALESKHYDLVNFSIGPDLPVEDDDVHVWTAVLDEHLCGGKTLATVAVGNSGNSIDPELARIQPPADCVNALSLGACDSRGSKWKRAAYSSVGPGRSPGIVKPDALAFGGSRKEPFWVLDAARAAHASPITGTSFAAPYALRTAASLRGYFGPVLTMVGIKALLIHRTERDDGMTQPEVGWGRIPPELSDLVLCRDEEVHVIYQDKLKPGKWTRARIPLPAGLEGMVTLSATFCFACQTDPQHPIHYTRSGLEIAFRPHDKKFRKPEPGKPMPIHPVTQPFFGSAAAGSDEHELREDAHKWETVLHNSVMKRASSFQNSVFDIHYNAREAGRPDNKALEIPYALVISVRAPKTKQLYDKIVTQYRALIQPLQPRIQIPLRNQ
jgi:hypothetical protein